MLTLTVEQEIKQQFARLFVAQDATLFKRMADYYFKYAAFLKTADIEIAQDLKLLARNCQKRLFIGIGTELLLKATYLKHGFSINKVEQGQAGAPTFPFTFQAISGFSQTPGNTYMLGDLVDELHVVFPAVGIPSVMRGLRIANYRDIETALITLYLHAFQQTLQLQFSFGPNETALWRIR